MILLQIVMVSPGTFLVKNHESRSGTNESYSVVKKKMRPNLKMVLPLCNQTVNLKTDSKTLYYSTLKLKYSLSILKHNKGQKKYASLNSSHNNCHRNYTNGFFFTKYTRSDQLGDLYVLQDACHELFCLWGFLCVRDAGCRGNKITA